MILFRTKSVDQHLAKFAADVSRWSGQQIAFIIDERDGEKKVPPNTGKVSLTYSSCEKLGLYCPPDFAWRCGDYGLYLARKAYPEVSTFWLTESDVRFAGTKPAEFFSFFESRDEEFLASYLKSPEVDWAWNDFILSKDFAKKKCFFPVCRLSARAIDHMLSTRQHHSTQWSRRRFWANDEGFVATTLIGSNFSHGDLNDFNRTFYDVSSFHFETIMDGSFPIQSSETVRLYHPVLFDDALKIKKKRLATRKVKANVFVNAIRKFDQKIGMQGLARRKNSSLSWIPFTK